MAWRCVQQPGIAIDIAIVGIKSEATTEIMLSDRRFRRQQPDRLASARGSSPSPPNAAMARSLHADACRDHTLVAWVVMWDLPAYPARTVRRDDDQC
jgi:hypothetical protein